VLIYFSLLFLCSCRIGYISGCIYLFLVWIPQVVVAPRAQQVVSEHLRFVWSCVDFKGVSCYLAEIVCRSRSSVGTICGIMCRSQNSVWIARGINSKE